MQLKYDLQYSECSRGDGERRGTVTTSHDCLSPEPVIVSGALRTMLILEPYLTHSGDINNPEDEKLEICLYRN